MQRIFDTDYAGSVYLTEREDGLELEVEHGDDAAKIVLGEAGIRKLRLALSRYEQARAREAEAARRRPEQ
jgi:hypothetical protein